MSPERLAVNRPLVLNAGAEPRAAFELREAVPRERRDGAAPRLVAPARMRGAPVRPGRDAVLRALGPLLLLAAWSACSATGLVREQTLAAPWAVAAALIELIGSGTLWENLSASLLRAGAGLGIGLSLGLALGLVTGLSRLGDQLLDPSLQMLRTIPFLAVAPLLVLWFGIGEDQKVLVIALATCFPFYLNTHAGVRGVDPKVVEAGEVFGLSRWRLIRAIILPGALPSMLVGLRQSLGVSLIALIVAEQSNAPRGIGFLMMSAQQFFQAEILLVCVWLYAVWGLLGDLLVRWLERVLMPWRSPRRA